MYLYLFPKTIFLRVTTDFDIKSIRYQSVESDYRKNIRKDFIFVRYLTYRQKQMMRAGNNKKSDWETTESNGFPLDDNFFYL